MRSFFAVLLAAAVVAAAPSGTVLWNYTSPSAAVKAPLAFGSSGITAFSTGAAIVGLSTATGTVTWTVPGNYSAVAASSDGSTLYALGIESAIAIDAATGSRKWTNFMVMPNTAQAPTVAKSALAFFVRGGYLIGLHLNNGSTAWLNTQLNCTHSLARLAAEEDALFAACHDTFQRIHAGTGNYLWKVAENAIYMPLAIGPRVFVLVVTSETPELSGNLSCYEISTGNKIWTYSPGEYLFASPTAGPAGSVLLPAWYREPGGHQWTSTMLLWLNVVNGNATWSYQGDISSGATYAASSQLYYLGEYAGVQCLTYNSTFVWGVPTDGFVDHPPAIQDSKLLFKDTTGVVTAVAL